MLKRAFCMLAFPACMLIALAVHPDERQRIDTALVLALDVSGSVTEARWKLQREGYASAFRDPEIIRRINTGQTGKIAVTLVEWSECALQAQSIPWAIVGDVDSARTLSTRIGGVRREFDGGTCPAGGLLFAADLIASAPFNAARTVIDLSGDGSQNEVFLKGGVQVPVSDIRDQVVGRGITINGLAILIPPGKEYHEDDLAGYYRDNIIGGPGAFLVVVKDADDRDAFAEAIKQKLLGELLALR